MSFKGSSPLARGGRPTGRRAPARPGLIPARAGRTGANGAATGPTEGSSPLARGGPGRQRTGPRPLGLIPARAGRTGSSANRAATSGAHPRSRGADVGPLVGSSSWWGSSPLARGGLGRRRGGGGRRGLIPARAGRTSKGADIASTHGAHPRSRGADRPTARTRVPHSGSSPLARGGPPIPSTVTSQSGLIPTRAGRTRWPNLRRWCSRAHPRSRGADHDSSQGDEQLWGSSPLARGGRHERTPCAVNAGLIPARAGRTSAPPRATGTSRAHPRSRGADECTAEGDRHKQGSSPLARGGPDLQAGDRIVSGLIPARAGRTGLDRVSRQVQRAHPRSRGADSLSVHARGVPEGSSPLARGGRGRHQGRDLPLGLIPARAGRTGREVACAELSGAHPRSRGADSTVIAVLDSEQGSSPLARGGL